MEVSQLVSGGGPYAQSLLKSAALGTLASSSEATSAVHVGFYEGRGPTIRGGLRPEPQSLSITGLSPGEKVGK